MFLSDYSDRGAEITHEFPVPCQRYGYSELLPVHVGDQVGPWNGSLLAEGRWFEKPNHFIAAKRRWRWERWNSALRRTATRGSL